MSKRYLPWMACAAIAMIGAPALAAGSGEHSAASTDATVTTTDNLFHDAVDGDSTVQITPGGKVTFRSPLGDPNNAAAHNVHFTDAVQPTVCNQTVQSPSSPGPLDEDGVSPMPNTLPGPGWEGYCTFNTPGTYSYLCQAHAGVMTGTVIVAGGTATPTATATATATATPTATPTATATATATTTATATPSPTASATASPTPSPSSTATPPAEPATTAVPVPAATATAPAPATAAPPATPLAKQPAPKIASATFKRSKRTITVAGTTSASGKVKIELAYKNGKATRKKTLSVAIKSGKFSGTIKLSAADARKAQKLSVTVSYPGSDTSKKSVTIKR